MKYSSGDLLYYVCPFIFTIYRVRIDLVVREDDKSIYYIDHLGAYLREENLFDDFLEAQRDALNKLEKFVHGCRYRILNHKPHMEGE